MTSTTNARELDRLRKARMQAQAQFAKQMKLLEQIAATAGEHEAITRRWNGQLAALAELSGGAANAAELSGLPKADIEAAVNRVVDRADVGAVMEAANLAVRRRRKPAGDAASDRAASDGAAPFDGVAGGMSEPL
jgi:hypothetical protein